MCECIVHNVGFYKAEPQAIHCMSFEETCRKLALSRSNSSIEVWDLAYAPHVQCVVPSGPNDSVEALAWCKGRLFSVGQLGLVREYNLQQLCSKQDVPVIAGPAWCLDVNRSQTQLAVGTENGYVNIFDVADNELTYLKILDKQEGRILCIAWDPTGEKVITGGLDVIRIWSVQSGHAVRRLMAGRSDANKETVVWCIAVTQDFTIITGDSRGFICFWDGKAGMQIDGFCSHKADVLSVCLDEEEKTVYCAGVDPVIVSFTLVVMKGGKKNHWVRSIERRVHTHDVRAMVMASNSCLYSGGVDGYLVMSSYPPKVVNKYPATLRPGCVQLCEKSRCMLLWYPGHLEVWRLGRAAPHEECGTLPLAQEPVQLLQLTVRLGEFLQCAALTSDCCWLAYSTASRLLLYSVTLVEGEAMQLRSCKFQGKECEPCHAIVFAASSQFAVLATNTGCLEVFQMSSEEGAVWLRTIHSLSDKVLSSAVKLLSVSGDDKYFAAADCSSNIAVWSASTWEVQFILPRHRCAPTAMKFHGSKHLVVVYADQKIVEVVLKTGKFTKLTKQLSKNTNSLWSSRAFPATSLTFDSRNNNLIFISDDNTLWIFNKDEECKIRDKKVARRDSLDGSESHSSFSQKHAFRFRKYKHLVHAEWLGEDELVVVEVSPDSLLLKLPPTLKQKTFGV